MLIFTMLMYVQFQHFILLEVVPTGDLLDKLLYALGILFLLSVITEKLTQLVRMYPRVFRRIALVLCAAFYIPIFNSFEKDIISTAELVILLIFNTLLVIFISVSFSEVKNNSKSAVRNIARTFAALRHIKKTEYNLLWERKRIQEKELTLLSFILGFIVAYVFNASFFQLLSDPSKIGISNGAPIIGEGANFELNAAYFNFEFATGLGYLLTAFFLSFGSKFFHDLLDYLMQVKNLRRHLNETAKDVATKITAITPQEIVRVLENKQLFLQKIPGFKNSNIGAIPTAAGKQYIAYLNFTGNLADEVEEQLEKVFAAEGVPIKIFINREAAHVKFGIINHASERSYIGSIACGLTDENGGACLLTCAHVLLSGNYEPDTVNDQTLAHLVNLNFNQRKPEGTWFYGCQDAQFDIALVSTREAIPATGFIPFTPGIDDLGMNVFFQGATTSFGAGFLYAINEPYDIKFDNDTVAMSGLLKLTNHDSGTDQSIAAGGDSGSLLYDDNNRALGMIIASTFDFTYAIPIESILTKVQKQIL